MQTQTTTATASASMACASITPDENGQVPLGACGAIWPYHPSFEANIAIAILFCVLTAVHVIQAVWFRQKFCWVIIMAGTWETAAFALRTLGARYGQVIPFYVLSTVLFILAPLWINAFIFMLASRIILRSFPTMKIWKIDARSLTKYFVSADIVCFVIQAGGSGMMSSTGDSESIADKKKLGQTIYLIGCGIQLVFIVLFSLIMYRFFMNIRRGARNAVALGPSLKAIQLLLFIIFMALILIFIRLVFRLAEFGPGITTENKLISNENYALALDAAPMIVAVALFIIFHPGLFLGERHNSLLKAEGYLLTRIES